MQEPSQVGATEPTAFASILGRTLGRKGPRRFIEITSEGEQTIKAHLEFIQRAARGLLSLRQAVAAGET